MKQNQGKVYALLEEVRVRVLLSARCAQLTGEEGKRWAQYLPAAEVAVRYLQENWLTAAVLDQEPLVVLPGEAQEVPAAREDMALLLRCEQALPPHLLRTAYVLPAGMLRAADDQDEEEASVATALLLLRPRAEVHFCFLLQLPAGHLASGLVGPRTRFVPMEPFYGARAVSERLSAAEEGAPRGGGGGGDDELAEVRQVYHDICSLWGGAFGESRVPTIPQSELRTQMLAALERENYHNDALVDDMMRRLLLPHTLPQTERHVHRPNAALFWGPPGTGKTTLIKMVLEGVGVRPIWFGTAPELSAKWVGDTEKQIKRLFDQAHATPNLLCCVVIDEIDTLTARRSSGQPDHKTDWLSVMLRIVGSRDYPNLLLLGSTNRKHAIDLAFLRPGRMDLHFFCGRLVEAERGNILARLLAQAAISVVGEDEEGKGEDDCDSPAAACSSVPPTPPPPPRDDFGEEEEEDAAPTIDPAILQRAVALTANFTGALLKRVVQELRRKALLDRIQDWRSPEPQSVFGAVKHTPAAQAMVAVAASALYQTIRLVRRAALDPDVCHSSLSAEATQRVAAAAERALAGPLSVLNAVDDGMSAVPVESRDGQDRDDDSGSDQQGAVTFVCDLQRMSVELTSGPLAECVVESAETAGEHEMVAFVEAIARCTGRQVVIHISQQKFKSFSDADIKEVFAQTEEECLLYGSQNIGVVVLVHLDEIVGATVHTGKSESESLSHTVVDSAETRRRDVTRTASLSLCWPFVFQRVILLHERLRETASPLHFLGVLVHSDVLRASYLENTAAMRVSGSAPIAPFTANLRAGPPPLLGSGFSEGVHYWCVTVNAVGAFTAGVSCAGVENKAWNDKAACVRAWGIDEKGLVVGRGAVRKNDFLTALNFSILPATSAHLVPHGYALIQASSRPVEAGDRLGFLLDLDAHGSLSVFLNDVYLETIVTGLGAHVPLFPTARITGAAARLSIAYPQPPPSKRYSVSSEKLVFSNAHPRAVCGLVDDAYPIRGSLQMTHNHTVDYGYGARFPLSLHTSFATTRGFVSGKHEWRVIRDTKAPSIFPLVGLTNWSHRNAVGVREITAVPLGSPGLPDSFGVNCESGTLVHMSGAQWKYSEPFTPLGTGDSVRFRLDLNARTVEVAFSYRKASTTLPFRRLPLPPTSPLFTAAPLFPTVAYPAYTITTYGAQVCSFSQVSLLYDPVDLVDFSPAHDQHSAAGSTPPKSQQQQQPAATLTPWFEAVDSLDLAAVRAHISRGQDVNITRNYSGTMMSALDKAIELANVELVRQLLDHGANKLRSNTPGLPSQGIPSNPTLLDYVRPYLKAHPDRRDDYTQVCALLAERNVFP
jgi:SpoVK/Ycf46/Vps4 family AAA+-type ATPase